MAPDKFFMLFVTFLWMGGLFAIVLSLCYVVQERRDRRVGWDSARFLASLYGSLATFCVGLALQAYAAHQPVSLWVATVWGMLAILFALRLVGVATLGIRYGWQAAPSVGRSGDGSTSISRQTSRFSLRTSLSLVLLLINLFILAWWGSAQLNAGMIALPLAEPKRGEGTSDVPVATTDLAHQPAPDEEEPQDHLANFESTATPGVGAMAPIVQVTPTIPATENVVLSSSQDEASPTLDSSNAGEVAGAVMLPTPTMGSLLRPTPLLPDELLTTVRSSLGGNVRKEPSLNAEVLTVLMDGTLAPLLGRTADSQWFLIQLADGTTGWISIRVIDLEVADNLVPVIEVN